MLSVKSSPNSELSSLEKAFAGETSRYVVGIDLGTTNCAVAFVDTHGDSKEVKTFRVEQMIDISTTSEVDTLPSFHYQLLDSEIAGVDRKHVFTTENVASIVGVLARQRGAELPGRAIASAKSWLCHKMVDRESDLLPWGGDEDVLKLSPVEASRRYLEHIRRCWDRAFSDYPLRDQDTIVTLPASFDEIARRLTIVSAKRAGIEKLHLIEEPQAAFYAWLARNAETWTSKLQQGQTILVCDIGGGTTDFTLIRVTGAAKSADETPSAETDVSRAVERELQSTFGLHRVAVGEHLMLGGDNLDIALAKFAEQKFCETSGQTKLSARQWDILKSQCRNAKERFLGPEPPEEIAIHFPSSGRNLIGNFQSVTIELEQARSLLLTGFFGPVSIDAHPAPQAEGFQEFGLPYATEPNILKHLAEFLWEHRRTGRSDEQLDQPDLVLARPDWVLFNGGVLESPQVRDAILNQIATWFSPVEPNWKPGCLEGNRLDLAVAHGAAYYGMVRRGEGVKIDATLARTYYLQVSQSPPKAICIMPASAHPGERFALKGMVFDLAVGEPVRFQLLSSNTRLTDQPGNLVEIDLASMNNMPPLQTVLRIDSRKSKQTVPVELEIELTEIGTLQVLLTATNEIDRVSKGRESNPSNNGGVCDPPMQWMLEFEARASTEQTKSAGMVANQESINKSRAAVEALLGTEQAAAPKEVIGKLTEWLGAKKHQWEPAVLRELWSGLIRFSDYRKRSPAHEARWMNLLGWCLRPGFGYPGDEWRVGETWRAVHNKLVHRTAENLSETIILWRRISGGFTAGQQKALFQDIWPRVRSTLLGGSGASLNSNVLNENLRLIGSLEWIEATEKIQVTQQLLDSLARKKNHSLVGPILWAAGRLGCRVPVYANLQMIVPARYVNTWANQLLGLEKQFSENNLSTVSLCLALWCRLTGDRYRDVDSTLRSRVIEWMEAQKVSDQQIELVRTGGDLSCEDATSVMGEALPLGFTLR